MNPLTQAWGPLLKAHRPDWLALYRDIHAHPELSMQETRTAGLVEQRPRAMGYEVTSGVGVTGVVGILRNGDGPTVMLRADMDALPMAEDTGLPYASTATARDADGNEVPVLHSCGHDLHVTWLIAAAQVLATARDAWSGTVLAAFQPGEETAQGARVMVGAAGSVSHRPGVILSAADSLQVTLHGRGSHGSQPQTSIDPVVMAAATVLRLQTIVSCEISPLDSAVLTVGALQAGTKENIWSPTRPR